MADKLQRPRWKMQGTSCWPKNPAHQYSLNNLALPTVDNEKDLGVYTTSCLSWAHHVEKITNKARSVCGWISRNVISREASGMLAIYKSLVRPHLEYAVQVWNPMHCYPWELADNTRVRKCAKVIHKNDRQYWSAQIQRKTKGAWPDHPFGEESPRGSD